MKIFDTHVHTKEVSTCGQVSGARMAEIYKAAGYDGIVITDHLTPDYFRHDSKTMTWEQFAENHMSGYHAAKKKGDEIGLKVLYGCELRFEGSVNDYLVYGMPNSFIAEHPEIFDMQIKAFSEIADKNGFLVFQAHPFRNDMDSRHGGVQRQAGGRSDEKKCLCKPVGGYLRTSETFRIRLPYARTSCKSRYMPF